MQLTEKQQEIKDGIMQYLTSPRDGYVLLYGFAGTGKTTTISHTLREYLNVHGGRVAMTAPVNKAVKVLRDVVRLDADYITIHSLLGLKPQINNKNGQMEFKQSGNSSIKDYDVVVVDESSMLNEELFQLLVATDCRIIFVGDYKQLRPVGNENTVAAPFRSEIRQEYNIKPYGLLDIIRQDSDSGIIPFSAAIRKGKFSMDVLQAHASRYDDIQFSNMDEVLDMFDSVEYRMDADQCKVIAYTNRKVDQVNKQIRDRLYNNPETDIVIGERLVVDKPVIMGSDILFTTNDEIQVMDYQIDTLPYFGDSYKVYNCLVGNRLRINILHEDSRDDYNVYVESLKMAALQTKEPIYWKRMYNFMDCFAQVKYSYAITCHKAQGSTYQNVFLCANDLNYCRDFDDRQALWYVGVTRAAKKVLFI